MALSSATITYDIADLVGNDFDARRTKVWVSTNVDSGVISDTVGNQIRVGDGLGDIAEDGTGSVSVWVPGTGSNPTTWQTYVHVDYAQRRPGGARVQRAFGPFTVTTSANLADLIQEQEIPPTYLSTVTTLLQTYVTAAQAAASAATALATSDGQTAANVNSGPLTRAAIASLKAWAKNPDQLVAGAVTYASGLLSSAIVQWPDGLPGVLTILSRQAGTDAVTSYRITRVDGATTTTYTQPTITRDSLGNATLVPQITVA